MVAQARSVPDVEGNSDADLVLGLQATRDPLAFEVLMQRHRRALFAFILRQTGDAARTEDLFQQTFMRVLGAIDTCRQPPAFKGWMLGIAAHLCRNDERHLRVRGEESPLDAASEHASSSPDPEHSAVASQARRRIQEALESVPPAQREVFVLHQYSQLSYEEIAQSLGIPLGTVKSRMNAALTQLRGLLAHLAEG